MSRWWWILAPPAVAVASAFAWAPISDDDPSYHANVGPILAKRCVPCHVSGGPAPFPLTTYADVKKRASLIRWVCIVGTMPPVDAESDLGQMAAVEKPSDDEMLTLQEWVRTGAKEGKATGASKITEPAWRLAAPDVIFSSRPVDAIAEEGGPYRKLILIDPKVTKSTSITGFDLHPAAPMALRHAYLAIVPQDEDGSKVFSSTGIATERLVGSWAAGHFAWTSPKGVPLSPGDKLAVWALYQPTGKPEDGGFQLGLRLSDPTTATPEWITLGNKEFAIEPADGGQTLRDQTTLTEARDILAIIPECKRFALQVRVLAVFPSGESKRLLVVRTWDRTWEGAYQPPQPIPLPAGTKIVAEIDYDNSGHSSGNREQRPTTAIRFGPSDVQELFWVHIQSVPHVP